MGPKSVAKKSKAAKKKAAAQAKIVKMSRAMALGGKAAAKA